MVSVLRRWLKDMLHVLVFGNFYIALCAVVMCLTTARLFHLHMPDLLVPFIFVGTLGSYSLHVYLTDATTGQVGSVGSERADWIIAHKQALLALFLGSCLIGIWWLAQLRTYLSELLPVILLTFLYTAPKINLRPFRALRRIAILKTTYLTLVWTYVTVGLPLMLSTYTPITNPIVASA